MIRRGILNRIPVNFEYQLVTPSGAPLSGISVQDTFPATRTLFLDIQLTFLEVSYYTITRYRNGVGVIVDSLSGGEQNLTQVYSTGDTIQIEVECGGTKSTSIAGDIYLRKDNINGRIIATYEFAYTS